MQLREPPTEVLKAVLRPWEATWLRPALSRLHSAALQLSLQVREEPFALHLLRGTISFACMTASLRVWICQQPGE